MSYERACCSFIYLAAFSAQSQEHNRQRQAHISQQNQEAQKQQRVSVRGAAGAEPTPETAQKLMDAMRTLVAAYPNRYSLDPTDHRYSVTYGEAGNM